MSDLVTIQGASIRGIVERSDLRESLTNPVVRAAAWLYDSCLDRVDVEALEVFPTGFTFRIAARGAWPYVHGRLTWSTRMTIEIVTQDAASISNPDVALDVAAQLSAVATALKSARAVCNTVFFDGDADTDAGHRLAAMQAFGIWKGLAP